MGVAPIKRRLPIAAAIDIANAYTSAVYLDDNGNETYFGMSEVSVYQDTLFQLAGCGRPTAMKHSMMVVMYCSLTLVIEYD
jgi:hypothetical protein